MTSPIHVGVWSSARLVREVIGARLAGDDAFHLVRPGRETGKNATDERQRLDVALVHASGRDAVLRTIRWLTGDRPKTAVVVLGAPADQTEMVRYIEAGASTCLDENAGYRRVRDALRDASHGRTSWSLATLTGVVKRVRQLKSESDNTAARTAALSSRELEVARLVAEGLLNKQIARRLGVTVATVKSHVQTILRKMGVARRYSIRKCFRFYELKDDITVSSQQPLAGRDSGQGYTMNGGPS